jgi:signal transduction histidine kinase
MVIVIVALLVDTFFLKVYDLYSKDPTSTLRLFVFIIISLIYCIGQYVLLRFIKLESKELRLSRTLHRIRRMHNIMTIVQYVLTAILVYVILQILMTTQYSTVFISLATSISCIVGCSMLAILTQRFFSWFNTHRDHVVFLYALSAAVLAITTVILFVFVDVVLWSTKPDSIMPKVGGTGLFIAPGTTNGLDSTYTIFSILSFILTWLATTMLLRYHSKKIGRIRYWISVGLPLIFFTTQFFSLFFNLFVPLLKSDPVFYGILLTITFTFSKFVGGIFFGIAFWMAARRISPDNIVRKYMIISAYGLVVLFISIQITGIIVTSYPPFGLITTLFIGLSCYMVLIGIYSSAVSISQDIKLRKVIRKSTIEESKLLISIGSAQLEQEIQSRAVKVAKEQQQTMAEQTGVQSSLTDQDMKQYVSEVLKEIHVLQNMDDILKKGKEILESSTEYFACSKAGGIRLVYNNYFDSYEKVMQEYSKGEHRGIRLVTSIDRESVDIVKKFLSIGVQIRHVKNMPPIDFAVSDKEMIATIEKMESGQIIQKLLVSSEQPYIDHFTSIFDELWKNGIDANYRIKAIQEGIDTEGIEIIQNPAEIQKFTFDLVKSAKEELLILYSSANAFHRQEYVGAIQSLKEAAYERGVSVRILTPADDSIVKTAQRWTEQQQSLNQQKINMRFIEAYLQTKVSLLVADGKFSLAIELKDDAAYKSYEAVGLATYSNSKPTVLSYVSIFENLWKQTELYEGLKEIDKLKDEFINIAAHELRTPIQPILGLSGVLRSQIKNSEQQVLLDVIVRNAKRLQRLSEDILDVTKIESQNLMLKKEVFNLNDIISNAISDTMNHIIKEKKENSVKLEFINSKEKGKEGEGIISPVIIEADKGRITQVISNLLANAVKFTNEGTIRVAAEKKDNEVVISIKDTGTGIHPEILPRLFTKFATTSNAGTGLGLFISKSIVKAHGGRIWAENNRNEKGAAFYFSLPLSTRAL